MATKSTDSAEDAATPDLQRLVNDIAATKRDLAALGGHLQASAMNGPGDAARSAIGQIEEEEAARVYETVAAQGERSAKALGRQIEENPMIGLLLAFGLGILGGRLFVR